MFSVETKSKKSKLEHKAYSSSSSVTTLSTETLAEDLHICEDWNLSIDLKLPERSMTEWRKIFGVQVNETTDLTGGSRIPTVWIRPDQSNIMLMLAYSINTNQSYTYNITKKVNAGNWMNLKISQVSGVYEIKVDYKLVYDKNNSMPKTWRNVKLLTGTTNGKENISTIVHYRNFKINTCKAKGKTKN